MANIERFQKLEKNYSLFDFKICGVPIWERIRLSVYREINRNSGIGKAQKSINFKAETYIDGIKLWLKNIFYRNPYLSSGKDILFIGNGRRKKLSDGYWWDIQCDPIHEKSSLDTIHLERSYLLEHRSPAKTPNLRYLDLIDYTGTIQRKLGLCDISFTSEQKEWINKIEDAINNEFNIDISLYDKIKRSLQNRKCRIRLYKGLLSRIDPQLAVIVVSSGKPIIIEACKDKEIPVVELQHGVIHPNHLAYSFSGERTKEMFPDYLLTWGEFWETDVDFPVPDERIIPVGYPHLEQSIKQYKDTQSQSQILFISQGTIGEQLSKFAMEIDSHSNIDYSIKYKLHPGEYDQWKDRYPWLENADFEIIDSSDPPLYKLFSESSVQVGVYSTALYEGLGFDLETYIFDCFHSEVMEPLIEQGAAELVSSSDELASSLGNNSHSFDTEFYFVPNATDRMIKTLTRLSEGGNSYYL